MPGFLGASELGFSACTPGAFFGNTYLEACPAVFSIPRPEAQARLARPSLLIELTPITPMSSPTQALKPKREYPNGVPSKFDLDGNVQSFPGNTILSHLSLDSELYASLLVLYDKLRDSHLSSLYTLLPPSSWHMTVFEGVCDQVRKPGFWPDDLAPGASLQECTEHFSRKLQTFDLQCKPPFRMTATGFDPLKTGIGVHLEFRTTEEDRGFRAMRDRLAELLHIRHPQHAKYGLHLSMAYLLRHLDDEQRAELTALLMDHFESMPREFELGAPEYCRFQNMFAFERLFYLGDPNPLSETS
ncbi:DUF1868-domain-containing protein [Thozetella sp. PMI_491]|nr:DUF1868-domain-containing protein [Thozetella sp. PMI_491]